MKDNSFNSSSLGNISWDGKLKSFFISHLNIIYCAKSHLVERLPEIIKQVHFADLEKAITQTLTDVEKQMARMDEIFVLLEVKPSFANCKGLIGMVEDAYDDIHEHSDDVKLRDMAILFYMQNIESMEIASFQVLQLVAVSMNNKPIQRLLLENFNEAKADRALLLLIATKYITN